MDYDFEANDLLEWNPNTVRTLLWIAQNVCA